MHDNRSTTILVRGPNASKPIEKPQFMRPRSVGVVMFDFNLKSGFFESDCVKRCWRTLEMRVTTRFCLPISFQVVRSLSRVFPSYCRPEI